MNKSTKHRGPDGSGIFVNERISLGHNLLAITEIPHRSRQPFKTENESHILLYNGEIYNYKDLRKELEWLGERFTTDGDTEVVFKGLVKYGDNFLRKLDGMFAVAFYDKASDTVLLARDKAGMKPLYFYSKKGRLIFSSEIRGILAHNVPAKLNHTMTSVFFTLGYVPGPETLFQDIHKINPGQYIIFNVKGDVLKSGWFNNREVGSKSQFEPPKLKDIISNSVEAHTMGLRPFGLYLSGGLDSTVILHELAGLDKSIVKTYTTRFDSRNPKYNEDADCAKKLCERYNIEHHELLINENDFINAVESSVGTIEEPRYNHSVPAYWLLAKEASKDITVILNGSGGDEMFLGYPRYLSARIISSRYHKWPNSILNILYSLKAFKNGQLKTGNTLSLNNDLEKWAYVHKLDNPIKDKRFKLHQTLDLKEVTEYLRGTDNPVLQYPLEDDVNAIAEYDRLFWLADEEFLRTDKISMHFGMEGRFPFLANNISDYANSLSADIKLEPELKSVIRKTYKDDLPDFIIKKNKTGWNAPIAEWMDSKFGEMVHNVLSAQYYSETNQLFDFDHINRNFIDNINKHSLKTIKKFLPIFYFQIWAREFNVKL